MGETLTLLSLHDIEQEPELLKVDGERIRRQMQEVAVGHYRAFISAADAVQNITHEITAVDEHLKTLIAEIPKLITGCNDFMEDAQQILEKRQLNRTLLANHSSLLDLLEIPQLMDACVRNGNYDEALDLEAFVSKLAMMHSRLPVIQSLEADVRHTTQSLLAQILQRLRSNIPLPECLRVIGYLRRLAVFNEHEIRLQFLRCREAWLVGIIDDLDQSNPYEYLKRMADCHRVHLFDVVMQYRAIFSDDTSGHEENTDGGLLYSWAMHRVSSHLNVLRDVLPQITEGPNLAIILDQCMYCGMSLGRVGLDFRGLLPPLFESSVHDLFVRNMSVTVDNFQHVLDSHRWVPLPPVTLSRVTSSLDHALDDVAPPYSIMEHPPLAAFVNGVLAALNELRHCAPINLKATLALELQCALQSVANSLLRYNATRIVKDSEKTLFLAMCRAFIEVVCPYCILCFGKCCSGGSALIQTNEVLEGVRKLVSTSTSYSKEIRNGSRSLDLNQLPQDLPPAVVISEAANGRSQDANGNGNITENGHGGSLLEEGVEVENSAVVDEPRQEKTPDSNPSPDSQNVEPRAMASGGHISETTEPAVVLLLLRVRKSRRNSVLANEEAHSVHPRPDSIRFRGTWNWYPFGIGARLRWVPAWAGYPFGLGALGGSLSTHLGLISVRGGYLNRSLPVWGGYAFGVHTRLGIGTRLGRVSVSGGTGTDLGRVSVSGGMGTGLGRVSVSGGTDTCLGLPPLGSYPSWINTRLGLSPASGLYPFGVDTRFRFVPVWGSMSGANSIITYPIPVERPLFNTYFTHTRIPIEVPSCGSRHTPRCVPEVALMPSLQGALL